MEKELNISTDKVLEAYNNADAKGKELLEKMFGKEILATNFIMLRLKTFEDACRELGDEHPFVRQYMQIACDNNGYTHTEDFLAYLKLRIIVADLNEGWKPTFGDNEWRYYPSFVLQTYDEYKFLSNEDKEDCVPFDGAAHCSFTNVCSTVDSSRSSMHKGSFLCLKSHELAKYCGKQFIDIWKKFIFI